MEDSIAEEEYIDMDVSSAATVFTRPSSPPPPPQSRDFEFQMSGKPLPEMDGITSPADELFYEGKLLPLHLHKLLLRDSSTPTHSTESMANANANANADAAAATPYVSCNASPATSCYVSGELDPEGYFGDECRTEELAQLHAGNSKSWSKKLRLIKQSSLSLKLKASRAYLKSLFFTRSGCSDDSCSVPKAKECPKAKKKASGPGDVKRASSSLRRVDAAERMVVEGGRGHRRSFSGAIKRRGTSDKSPSISTTSTSSNSSSFSSVNSNNSNRLYGSSEAECSIQGAIAYCKRSQQEEVCARKTAATTDDVEFYALSASRIAADCEKQERPEICRG